jgi:AraC-like DNA-binding protein
LIKNLNTLSFSEFGEILLDRHPNRGFPSGRDWKEQIVTVRHDMVRVYRLEAEKMYLDFESGMTVLAVSHTPASMEYFYLDKPVAIPGGIYFSLIPISDSCTVRCCLNTGGIWSVQDSCQVNVSFSVQCQMDIRNVYTIFYQEKEKGFFFKGERHEMSELTYVDKGRLHSVVNGSEMALEQGNMTVYGPGQWHMQYADPGCTVGFITISFDVQYPFLELLLNQRFSLDNETSNLLLQILQEYNAPDMFSNDMIISKLQQLLLTVLRMKDPRVEKLHTSISLYNENQILHGVLTYISDHICDKLPVSSVASANNVSVSYLTTLFQRHLRIPPGEYIRRLKLEESKKLIREGRDNFTQIAKRLQYSTVHHFSRQFKEYYGITPTQYAKSIHFTEGRQGRPQD